jgi:hypothetical protein
MIILKEENLNTWHNMEFHSYHKVLALAFQTHATGKQETNILPVSNKWMFGKSVNKKSAVVKMLDVFYKTGELMEIVKNLHQEKRNPEEKMKMNIHLFREIQHPDYSNVIGVLYYDLIINITPPFAYGTRLNLSQSPEEWIQKLAVKNPDLVGLNNIDPPELIYRPFILIQAFTGGFKPKYSRNPRHKYRGGQYAGKGVADTRVFNAVDSFGPTPSITSEEFNELIKYQNQAKDRYGSVLLTWEDVWADNRYPFREV